jgi:hypothetical protein
MVKRVVTLAVAASIAYLSLAHPASPQGAPEQVFHQVSRTIPGDPVARLSCGEDTCIHSSIPRVPIDIPSGFGPADLVATLTVEYAASRNVTAALAVAVRSGDQPFARMRPGLLRLRGGGPTTTSASWLLRGVSTGEPLSVRIGFRRVGPASKPWHATLHEALLLVEAVSVPGPSE